jgi:hypothetical protein
VDEALVVGEGKVHGAESLTRGKVASDEWREPKLENRKLKMEAGILDSMNG